MLMPLAAAGLKEDGGIPVNGEGCGLSPRLENDMQTVPTCALRGLGDHSTSMLTTANK